jgi:hypothetical protein
MFVKQNKTSKGLLDEHTSGLLRVKTLIKTLLVYSKLCYSKKIVMPRVR